MLTERERVVELCNKLFIYTDYREWERLKTEVFTTDVYFDMSSMNGDKPQMISATDLCDQWRKGFEGLDAVHHQAGNYLITITENGADIFCYATASHYKNQAANGTTREFVGSYHLHATYTPVGWRLDRFQYNMKYVSGNKDLT